MSIIIIRVCPPKVAVTLYLLLCLSVKVIFHVFQGQTFVVNAVTFLAFVVGFGMCIGHRNAFRIYGLIAIVGPTEIDSISMISGLKKLDDPLFG